MTWQAQDGSWTLTVCVRGTFSLIHGREAALADAQEPVSLERHYDDDPRQGIYAPSDLVPYKPRTDVILVGSAFTVEHEPVDALIARLAVGEIDKSVGVIGDRRWIEGPDGLEPSPPVPFRAMPLRNELAARTVDNPGGFDLTAPPIAGAPALPNLEAIDDRPEEGRVIGFGALPLNALARRSLLTPEAWAWLSEGGFGPVPPGFDFGFYNAAPRDQQIGVLRDGATIIMENLHREHARLEVKLPAVRPKVFLVSHDTERAIEVAMRCDTLWIDTDRALLSLSWRGVIGLGAIETQGLGTVLVAAEAKGRELRYKQIQRMLLSGASEALDEDTFSDARTAAMRREVVRESFIPPAPQHVSIEERPSDPTVDTLRMERPRTVMDIELVSEPGVPLTMGDFELVSEPGVPILMSEPGVPLNMADIELVSEPGVPILMSEPGVPLTMADIELVSEPGVPIVMSDLELVSEPGLWDDISVSEIVEALGPVAAQASPEAPGPVAQVPSEPRPRVAFSEILSEETLQDDRLPNDVTDQD